MPYSLDTSALIDAWDRFYPPDHFPTLWQRVERGIADGQLVAIDEVQDELSRRSEAIHDWLTDRGLFVPISVDVQESVREILALRPQLVGAGAGRGLADPFVIALARVHGYTVVTQESRSSKRDAAKIPNVCEHFGIRHIEFPTLVVEMGWTF